MPLHLTFDDGPSADGTPAVLAALAAVRARATFFVLGSAVREHPWAIEATVAAGHRVELHADRHVRHDGLTTREIRDDALDALVRLAAFGLTPTWWRTPWGRVTDGTLDVAAELGLALIGWDADTHDWRGDPADAMLEALDRDVPDGGVVLAHDALGPGALRTDCQETAAFVPLAVAWGRSRGLEPEVLPNPAPPRPGRTATDPLTEDRP